MKTKILLVALAAVSAVVLALPAMASALVPLHLNPTPSGAQTIHDIGANPHLSTTGGTTIECASLQGSATFESGGTTGTMNLTFGDSCKVLVPGGESCTTAGEPTGNIATTTLPFHLVTLPGEYPGVLVTPNSSVTTAHFATFTCRIVGFPITVVVKGNGLIGTIVNAGCGWTSNTIGIDFVATAHGVQEHTKIAGTETVFTLNKGADKAALDAIASITLSEESELDCT